jgi:hypothetical protein
MKYMLLTYLDEKAWASLSKAERQKIMAEAQPHIKNLLAKGKFLAGAPLEPSSAAATVRLHKGKRLVTDGPFAETREQIGGYTLIEAGSLEEATNIAGGFLGTRGFPIIEVRQVAEMEGLPAHPKARRESRRRAARLAAVALIAISMGASVRQAATSPALTRFLNCYRVMSTADAPISFWERLAYSFALARASKVFPLHHHAETSASVTAGPVPA